jgi:hypothetical protein
MNSLKTSYDFYIIIIFVVHKNIRAFKVFTVATSYLKSNKKYCEFHPGVGILKPPNYFYSFYWVSDTKEIKRLSFTLCWRITPIVILIVRRKILCVILPKNEANINFGVIS